MGNEVCSRRLDHDDAAASSPFYRTDAHEKSQPHGTGYGTQGKSEHAQKRCMLLLAVIPAVSSVVCAVYVVLFYGMLSDIDALISHLNRTELSLAATQLLQLERCALRIMPVGC